jgi:simple sugar transport system ATP-binding protein
VSAGPSLPELSASRVSKRFGSLQALDDVSLSVAPATVHALLGENGAGKSTLVKCIMGYHSPDTGELALDGARVDVKSPRHAQALGIGMVYQHFTLVPNMTVAENLVLARAKLPFFLKWGAERAALSAFCERMQFRTPLDSPVRSLSAGEKQKLEILKQLYLGSRIIILDEPTSVLTPQEADEILGMLRSMVDEKRLSLLIITHKLREVTRYADEVTVLRRGRLVGRGQARELSPAAMAEMMVGGAAGSSQAPGDARPSDAPEALGMPTGATPSAPKHAPTTAAPLLEVKALEADDDLGVPALRGLSLEVRPGEIVGIAAVAGNGQEELVEVLAGQRRARAGEVRVAGERYLSSRAELLRHGVRCLPEEPLRNACVASMSVAENMAFSAFDRPPMTIARYGVSRRAIAKGAEALVASFGVRTPSVHTPIGQLSGGNVQRAVLARELSSGVSLLVVANPCMGLDFRAVAEIHQRVRETRARGAAVLLVSADLDEVLSLSDRVLVMSEGRVVHETAAEGADINVIGRFMAGHAGAA